VALQAGSLSQSAGEEARDAPGFAALFGALPVAVIVVDPQNRVTRANAEAEQLLNLSERAMTGQSIDALFTLPAATQARRDGTNFAIFDTAVALRRGGAIRADYFESPVQQHPGWRMVMVHAVANSRRMGHAERGGARAAIGAAAILAHEIKNPLSGIRGAAQLLARQEGDQAGRGELTALIIAEVDRVAALIDRMQDFTDTRPRPLTPENIYPLLDHARRLAHAGFARGLVIEERFDPSLPPVLIERDAMLQVILNLLKNACEATAGQTVQTIVLSTGYRHGMAVNSGVGRRPLPIEICVADNGPGPPDDIADHLFEPFVSGKPEGKGLGLALVDKLVRDMGGIVQFARDGDPPMTTVRLLLARGAP